MMHPGPVADVGRRRRVFLAALQGAGWNRDTASARVRTLAADALEAAGVEVRRGRDDRVRALVDRAVRRLTLVAELEAGPRWTDSAPG